MNPHSPPARFRLWRWFSYLFLALLFALAAGSSAFNHHFRENAVSDDAALWRPRFATPAIVALDSPVDRTFTAEVKAPPSARDWSASIANDLKSWPCEIVSATYAAIDNDSEQGWQIKIRVPSDASPELFALTIACDKCAATQPQAVSVITDFATDFYILHMSDEQIVNQYHTDPSGQYYHMVGTWEELMWMQQSVNLINPRFVLVTGDQIDFNGALDGWNNWANWGYTPKGKKIFSFQETSNLELRLSAMYKDCHKGYHVPYVETPGNHDVTPPGKLLSGSHIDWHPISASIYEQQFGQRTYSFRMGDFYVLMHDWSDAGLADWAAKDYDAALNDPTIRFRLIGQHYHAKWNGAPTGNYPFTPTNCDLMLIGHGHRTLTIQTSPYYIYMDGATFFWGRSGFFNFRRAADGWTCDQTQGPRDVKKDVWGLFTDNGATREVSADVPDTRNITNNFVTINNALPEEFYDGRLRFILPKGYYDQAVNGTILAQYNCFNETRTAVLVKVDIPASGTITVSIVPPEPNGVAQVSKPAVSPISKSADRATSSHQQIWKTRDPSPDQLDSVTL
ncbi:MAG TPA: metallophosphoesterase [Candidatus Sulfotelmatobacter sp.]|nr:metallophosphoesterase [Candidatus Sulfotelmatobacter sp.]